jgi:hypothetical protein
MCVRAKERITVIRLCVIIYIEMVARINNMDIGRSHKESELEE